MPILGSFGAGSARGFGETAGSAPPYEIIMLVVAGGGTGAGIGGAGGGAGGYRTSTQQDIPAGETLTVPDRDWETS